MDEVFYWLLMACAAFGLACVVLGLLWAIGSFMLARLVSKRVEPLYPRTDKGGKHGNSQAGNS